MDFFIMYHVFCSSMSPLLFCFLLSCPLISANYYETLIHSLSKELNQRDYFLCTETPSVENGGLALTVLPWNDEDMNEFGTNEKKRRIMVTDANKHKQATLFIARRVFGSVCFKFQGDYFVGKSMCNKTIGSTAVIKMAHTDKVWGKVIGDLNVPSFIETLGVYWICGNLAHRWLPSRANGICYLGYVLPKFSVHKTISASVIAKRSLTNLKRPMSVNILDRMLGGLYPSIAVQDLYNIVVGLSGTMELITNKSIQVDSYINRELAALRCMASQNRYVLDFVVAERGGVCRLVKGKCCTYIPDYADNITLSLKEIRETNQKLNSLSFGSLSDLGSFGFLEGTLGWLGSQILKWFLLGLSVLFAIAILLCVGRLLIKSFCCRPVRRSEVRLISRGEIDAEEIEMERLSGLRRIRYPFYDR